MISLYFAKNFFARPEIHLIWGCGTSQAIEGNNRLFRFEVKIDMHLHEWSADPTLVRLT